MTVELNKRSGIIVVACFLVLALGYAGWLTIQNDRDGGEIRIADESRVLQVETAEPSQVATGDAAANLEDKESLSAQSDDSLDFFTRELVGNVRREIRLKAKEDEVRAESWETTIECLIYSDHLVFGFLSDSSPSYYLNMIRKMPRVRKLLDPQVSSDANLRAEVIELIDKASVRFLTELPPFAPSGQHVIGETVISSPGAAAAAYVLAELDVDGSNLPLIVALHDRYQRSQEAHYQHKRAKQNRESTTSDSYVYSDTGAVFADSEFLILSRLDMGEFKLEAADEFWFSQYRVVQESGADTGTNGVNRNIHQRRVFELAKSWVENNG